MRPPPAARVAEQAYEDSLIATTDRPDPPPDWVARLGEGPSEEGTRGPWRLGPAIMEDTDYAREEPVPVRRIVYRVRFVVPPIFRYRRQQTGPQLAELQVDVGHTRLRARFVGPGWPGHAGAEVRLREDRPGVYLFDASGGRWLSSGKLAMWFEGRRERPVSSGIRVLRDYKPVSSEGPGALMCALLAEWVNQPRDYLAGRCRGNVIPPGFRFGPWRGELTAVLPMDLPRRELRADEHIPPNRPAAHTSRTMLSDVELEKLTPQAPLPASPAAGSETGAPAAERAAAGSAALRVHNLTHTRVVVMLQGLPLGYVDAGESGRFDPIPPGYYRIGTMRPFGVLESAPVRMAVPGELRLGGAPGPEPSAVTPPASAGDPAQAMAAQPPTEESAPASAAQGARPDGPTEPLDGPADGPPGGEDAVAASPVPEAAPVAVEPAREPQGVGKFGLILELPEDGEPEPAERPPPAEPEPAIRPPLPTTGPDSGR